MSLYIALSHALTWNMSDLVLDCTVNVLHFLG